MNELPSAEVISALIGRIYDAALDNRLWEAFMQAIAPIYGSDRATAVLSDSSNPAASTVLALGFGPARYAEWQERFESEDYFWHACKQLPGGSTFVGTELIGVDDMHGTALYHELATPLKVEYLVGAVIEKTDDRWVGMTFLRPRWKENFDDRSKELLRILLPHIRRAFLINRQLATAEQARLNALDALEQSANAVVIFDEDGRIWYHNEKAEKLFTKGDGVSAVCGSLRFSDTDAQASFEDLLQGATATGQLERLDGGGAMHARRPSGERPYHVVVSPLNQRSAEATVSPQAACVAFIHDTGKPTTLNTACLQKLYDLTPVQSRFCQVLFRTGALDETMEELSITRNTAKWHLDRIFDKVGVRSQPQLLQSLALGLSRFQ